MLNKLSAKGHLFVSFLNYMHLCIEFCIKTFNMRKILLSVLLITGMSLSAASNPFFKKYSTTRETIPFNKIETVQIGRAHV